MKLVFICTNYGSIKCGIGMYTFNLVEELRKEDNLEVNIISVNTFKLKKIKKIFNIRLSKEINKYIAENQAIRDEKINFILEYPFMDWSIFNVIRILWLKKNFKNSNIILSIHEYYRVNYFRRKIIDILIKNSDSFIITDNKLKNILPEKPIIFRSIPSNIKKINFNPPIERKENEYCYFGLINKSKAFDEMIEAWKKYNKEKKYNLNIYTASDVNIDNFQKYNIKIFKDLDNIELSKELQKNKYMILPIKPYIDENNGSFKASLEHECIPIGKFREIYPELYININEDEYSSLNILEALRKSEKKLLTKNNKFSNITKFKNIANMILKDLKC